MTFDLPIDDQHAALYTIGQVAAMLGVQPAFLRRLATDVRPLIRDWAVSKGLPADALAAFRGGGYLERVTAERREKNLSAEFSYA